MQAKSEAYGFRKRVLVGEATRAVSLRKENGNIFFETSSVQHCRTAKSRMRKASDDFNMLLVSSLYQHMEIFYLNYQCDLDVWKTVHSGEKSMPPRSTKLPMIVFPSLAPAAMIGRDEDSHNLKFGFHLKSRPM